MSSAGGSRKRRRKNPDPEPVPEIPADDDYENAAVDYGDEYGGTQPVVEGQQQYGGGSRVVVQGTQPVTPLGYTDPFKVRVAPQEWDEDSFGGGGGAGASQDHLDVDAFDADGGGGGGGGGGLFGVQEGANWAELFPTEEVVKFWGANTQVNEFRRWVEHFLEEWSPERYHERDGTRPGSYYQHTMQKLFLSGMHELEVDMTYAKQCSPELYDATYKFPLEAVPILQEQANVSYRKAVLLLDEHALEDNIGVTVRLCNMPDTKAMRELKPEDIGHIVSVRGMVVRVTKLLPEMRQAMFECSECFHKEYELEERGRIEEPTRCSSCGANLPFELKHNQCVFIDKQFVRVQEAPDSTPEGETPSSLSVTMYTALVDTAVPGDRVVVTGVYKATPVKASGTGAMVKSVFKTHLEASHIQKTTKGKRGNTNDESNPNNFCGIYDQENDEEIERMEAAMEPSELAVLDQIHVASKHPDLYNVLIRSLAPSIHGHEDVKLGVLCQLFGGTGKRFTMCSTRSEINILLCGDPGVAKSQVLSHVNGIASRGIYTSGKGSSSVGLTAFLVRDADTGEFVLESGALVLSDRGICCIDEFDKMDDSTRSVLHEVMEQQTVSIAKAGIICTLNARSSILAAANPIDSTWNKDLNILRNLDISSTLLSRFDLIYLLLDTKDPDLDRKLAYHLCQMYSAEAIHGTNPTSAAAVEAAAAASNGGVRLMVNGAKGKELMSIANLSRYVAYAKAKIKPTLSKDAASMAVKAYLSMRKQRGSRNVVTATTRQLEAMIRLAEAHAKMRLSNEVTEGDVDAAKNLIQSALKDSCTDPETGMLISAGGDTHTGVTTHAIVKAVNELQAKNKWSGQLVPIEEIKNQIIDVLGKAVSTADMTDALAVLISRGQADPVRDLSLPFK